MLFNKYKWTLAAGAVCLLSACSDDDNFDPFGAAPEPPDYSFEVETPVAKPKAMWIDAHANLSLLSSKETVDKELLKIKDAGLNTIYLDVKPGIGYALYDSDILPHLTSWGGVTVNRDWDYLGYFIEKCDELEIDVIASTSALGFGDTSSRTGFVYDDFEKWGPMCQHRMESYNPADLVNIADEPGVDGAMLDPVNPEVQDLVVNMYKEIVTKYPGLKGVSIDYLRYYNNTNGDYGMSDANLDAYMNYWGSARPGRNDFINQNGGPGKEFARWTEFRTATITNLLRRIKTEIKAINPAIELHLWASADWRSRYTVGQNWASTKYSSSGSQYTDTYSKTGFAEDLDVFVLGAYTEYVWKKENPNSVWTVENFCDTWNNFIMDSCKCYGSIAIYGFKSDKQVSDATYLCMKKTGGFMAFELSHTNNGNRWNAIKQGIERYEYPNGKPDETQEN